MENEKMIPYFAHEGIVAKADVLAVFDELMTTLQVMHPRLYTGVMSRLT